MAIWEGVPQSGYLGDLTMIINHLRPSWDDPPSGELEIGLTWRLAVKRVNRVPILPTAVCCSAFFWHHVCWV